jgi:magnesium-protoporphyrin O-methyltransferase
MAACCGPLPPERGQDGGDPERYRSVFNAQFSRSITRRYERKGLRSAEQRIVDFLAARGLEGATVLEVGGGAGEIQLELLARGAARSTNLELSDGYEADAERLIAQAGVADRVTRRLGVDLAVTPDAVESADVVVLHRVVCCYPDYEKLLGAAADHARKAIAFSYPPAGPLARLGLRFGNAMLRLTGRSFRGFAHDPAAMVEVVRRHGLEPVYRKRSGVWTVTGAVRAVSPDPAGGSATRVEICRTPHLPECAPRG